METPKKIWYRGQVYRLAASTVLHVFDFDDTLFKSPEKPDWWPERAWWTNKDSLSKCVPKEPEDSWWNGALLKRVRKDADSDKIWSVLLSARVSGTFKRRVNELLRQQDLDFDEVVLKPKASIRTDRWKLGKIKSIAKKKDATQIHIWEDRSEDLDYIAEHLEDAGFTVKKHLVHVKPRAVSCPKVASAVSFHGTRYVLADFPKHPDTVIIKKNEFYPNGLTEEDIWNHYNKNKGKIVAQTKGRKTILWIKVDSHVVVKRKDKDKDIEISNAKDLEKYNSGRLIEVHPEIAVKTGKDWKTNVIFCDLDPKDNFPWKSTKALAKKVYSVFSKDSKVGSVEVHFSGGRGFHIIGKLKTKVDPDEAREHAKSLLEPLETDKIKLGRVGKNDMLRMDTTLLKQRGSLRAVGSLHRNTGLQCMKIPVSTLGKFEPKQAKISTSKKRKASVRVAFGPISFSRLSKISKPEDLLKKHDAGDLIAQFKYDGWKMMASRDDKVKLYSRRGKEIQGNFPSIVSVLEKSMPKDSAVLGEIVAYNKAGKQSISLIQSIAGAGPEEAAKKTAELKKDGGRLVYMVYDILEHNGKNVTKEPFSKRDALLRKVLKTSKLISIPKNYQFKDYKIAVEKALADGGEGVVFKPLDAPYVYGPPGTSERHSQQVKYKPGPKAHVDEVFVDSYTKGKEKLIFNAFQYNKGKPFQVGKLSGLPKSVEKDVQKMVDSGKKVVIEVSYQERTPTGKLRHMGWLRLRPDKPLKSVTATQVPPSFLYRGALYLLS